MLHTPLHAYQKHQSGLCVFLIAVTASTIQLSHPGPSQKEGGLGTIDNEPPLSQSRNLQVSQNQTIFDPDPNHLWNRLHNQFYLRTAWDGRTYGGDVLDPLLWRETEYLLSGPSHEQAIRVLDEFLSTNAEGLIIDPLKRALLQRDLWAVFDWLCDTTSKHQPGRKELERKLAQVIQRLALTPDQVRSLPNTYSAAIASKAFATGYDPDRHETPFLPPDLFRPNGPWVCLGQSGDVSGAPVHTSFFSGRSLFLVFMRLPGGRDATLAYLKQLTDYPKPLVPNSGNYTITRDPRGNSSVGTNAPLVLNPDLPQFPSGTQVALVRRMMLIDSHGELSSTCVTESVQIRVFLAIPSREEWLSGHAGDLEDSFEFRLSRSQLFAGQSGGLRAVAKDAREFSQFLAHPFDLLEIRPNSPSSPSTSTDKLRGRILNSCTSCHEAPGIHSLLATRMMFGSRGPEFPGLYDCSSSLTDQASGTIEWKHRQYNWGLLEGLWK